jgi:hypothetical protein
MHNNNFVRTLGKDLKKVKTWERATDIGSSITKNAGEGLVAGGVSSGQPELVAVGEGLVVSSKLLNKSNKLLKKHTKKKKNKNKK